MRRSSSSSPSQPAAAAGYRSPRPAWAGPCVHVGQEAPRTHVRTEARVPQQAVPEQTPPRQVKPRSRSPHVPAPSSTVQQLRSTHFASPAAPVQERPVVLSSARAAEPNDAAGVASRSSAKSTKAQNASTVFGSPRHFRSPAPESTAVLERVTVLNDAAGLVTRDSAKSTVAQHASTVFGSPRHRRPAEPERQRSQTANSTAAQLASTALPATQHVRPPELDLTSLANANSTKAQLASSVLPFGQRYETPPPTASRRSHRSEWSSSAGKPTKSPQTSLDQNTSASRVFGTPRYSEPPAPDALLSQEIDKDGTRQSSFAPGEWLLPMPRSASEGAPRTKGAQLASTSMPGTRHNPPPPACMSDVNFPGDDPRLRVRGKAEAAGISSLRREGKYTPRHSTPQQLRSSVFGTPRHTSPPPAPVATPRSSASASAWSKSTRNNSSVFPNQTIHVPPQMPEKPATSANPATCSEQLRSAGVSDVFGVESRVQPDSSNGNTGVHSARDSAHGINDESAGKVAGRLAPTTKAEQQRSSSIFGTAQHRSPMSSRQSTGPRFKDRNHALNNPTVLTNEQGFRRGPNNHVEQLASDASYATGHTKMSVPSPRTSKLGKSWLKIAFDGLPEDITTHRLHEKLSALPCDPSVSCARKGVEINYGGMGGLATGKAIAYLLGVPDDDHTANVLKEAQARGVFGGRGGKLANARVALDGRVPGTAVVRV